MQKTKKAAIVYCNDKTAFFCCVWIASKRAERSSRKAPTANATNADLTAFGGCIWKRGKPRCIAGYENSLTRSWGILSVSIIRET